MRRRRSRGISRRAFLLGSAGALGAAAVASPPGRDVLSVIGWWLTATTPPEARIIVPEGVSRGPVSLRVEVGAVPSWSFLEATLDGRPIEPARVIAIDTRQLRDGEHVIRVAVADGSLRRNVRWVEARFATDNTPPQVLLEPRAPTAAQGRTLLLQARANEPVQLAVSLDDAVPVTFAETNGTYVAFVGIDAAAPVGTRTLKLVAKDRAGNEATLDAPLQITRGSFLSEQIVLAPELFRFFTSGQYDLELQQLAEYYSGSGTEKLWDGPFDPPVRGVISSGFGVDRTYNGQVRRRHLGTDFDVPVGTPVNAVARGRVVFAETLPVRGTAVILDHGLGVHSTYYHLSRVDVRPGELVNRGQPIALSGASGMVTGPHLHFEIRVAGVAVEPMEWLRTRFL
ncbi:MAG: M23 family metallopeptidase [Chloroflexota bacterium]|nr:M23 family metallopeptidase [Dehalococcoidia bacterium]MDW8252726.1 M23 family metallopeptidase [Chloroflexota bacterium]